MSKSVIAVDLDDVLSASIEGWIGFSNEQWQTNLTAEDYDEDWGKMWKIDHDERMKRADAIYSSGLVRTFVPFELAKAVLQKLAKNYKLVVTTSRAGHTKDDTLFWLDTHFGDVFDDVHFAGFFDNLKNPKSAMKMTKAELLNSIGADYLIDDHPKHCFAAAEVGISSLLFGEYRWNRDLVTLPEGVTRVADWAAVLKYFEKQGA